MKRILLIPLIASVGLLVAANRGQRTAPQPNKPMPRAQVMQFTGELKGAKLSRDIRILWLYGPEDHGGGEHDYIRIKELFVPMLKSIARVTVEEAYLFPSREQFARADLMIQFLHLPDLTNEQLAMFQGFVNRGGSVVSIHESCIMRPVDRAKKLAGCIGCSWQGNKDSHWGKFSHDHPLFLKTEHPAFAGLPKSVRLNDESYWSLLRADNIEVIGTIGMFFLFVLFGWWMLLFLFGLGWLVGVLACFGGRAVLISVSRKRWFSPLRTQTPTAHT